MEDGEVKLQITLSHVYLEMARAVFSLDRPSGKSDGPAQDYPTTFGLLSVTILYSYLAVESFVNYQFCTIYQHAVKAHQACEKLGGLHAKDEIVPTYDDFYRQYGNTPLESIRLELKEKIKAVCSAYGISQIYDVDSHLWQDFCDILKESRDFLVHTIPDPKIFQHHMQQLVEKTTTGKYVEIAIGIILYFYEQLGKKPPKWLNQNELIQLLAVRPGKDNDNGS